MKVLERMQIIGVDVTEALLLLFALPEDEDIQDSVFRSLLELSRINKDISTLLRLKELVTGISEMLEIVDLLLYLGYVDEDMLLLLLSIFEKIQGRRYKYYYKNVVAIGMKSVEIRDDRYYELIQKLKDNLSRYLSEHEDLLVADNVYSEENSDTNDVVLSFEDLERLFDKYENIEYLLDNVNWYSLAAKKPSLVSKASNYLYQALDNPDVNRKVNIDEFDARTSELYNYVWEALWDLTTPI